MAHPGYRSMRTEQAAPIAPAATKKPRPMPLAIRLIRLGFRLGGQLAPALAGRIAYKLWFTPTRFKTPASEKYALETSVCEYLQINNHSIATYRWGQTGPTVLLVHGWSGRGTQLGAFVAPLLKAGYCVLSFDAPAHGKSTGKQTNLYQVADTILGLEHLFGPFEAVITHSFGGPCAALAMQDGLKTKRVASIAPPATTINLVEKFCAALRIPEKPRGNLVKRIETSFGKNIWNDISMVHTAKAITIPGMLIHDINDNEIPWQESQAIAQVWNNASFVKTSGLGHRRILRDISVVELVVSFISDGRSAA